MNLEPAKRAISRIFSFTARALGIAPSRAPRAKTSPQRTAPPKPISTWVKSVAQRSGNTIPVDPDFVGIIIFGTTATPILSLCNVDNPRAIAAINNVQANQGCTELGVGMQAAFQMLSGESLALIKRLVIISDGEATKTTLIDQITGRCAARHIKIDCISLGEHAGGALLKSLSHKTKGRFFTAKSLKELKKAVLRGVSKGGRHRFRGATCLLIDASASMNASMPADRSKTRIGACREACRDFIQTQIRLFGHKVR